MKWSKIHTLTITDLFKNKIGTYLRFFLIHIVFGLKRGNLVEMIQILPLTKILQITPLKRVPMP
jgi:hypothetical protein